MNATTVKDLVRKARDANYAAIHYARQPLRFSHLAAECRITRKCCMGEARKLKTRSDESRIRCSNACGVCGGAGEVAEPVPPVHRALTEGEVAALLQLRDAVAACEAAGISIEASNGYVYLCAADRRPVLDVERLDAGSFAGLKELK